MELSPRLKNAHSVGPVPPNLEPHYHTVTPEYPTLIVMMAVLGIILLFCFLGAPGVRDYCKKSIASCRCSRSSEPTESGTPGDDSSSAPTIILLPYGRMLVVDRNVFTQLNADRAGIDFMELSANLIRAHQLHRSSTRSVLDSENTSKGMSPVSLGCSPPSYDDIFGKRSLDLPPSYSELSLYVQRGRLKLDSMQGGDVNEDDVTCVMGVELVGVTRHFRGSAVAVDVEGGDHAGVARNGLDSPGSRVQIVPSSWKSLPNFGDQCSDPGARNSHHFSCGFRKTCSVNIEDETKRSNRTGEQNRPETSNKCETSRPGMPSSSERSNSSKRQGSVTAVRTPDCDETRSIFWRKNIKESHL